MVAVELLPGHHLDAVVGQLRAHAAYAVGAEARAAVLELLHDYVHFRIDTDDDPLPWARADHEIGVDDEPDEPASSVVVEPQPRSRASATAVPVGARRCLMPLGRTDRPRGSTMGPP